MVAAVCGGCGVWRLQGSVEEFEAFNKWLGELPHEHKFLVAGNHDYSMLSKLVRSPAREPKRGPTAPQWAPGQQVVATKGSKTGKRGTLVAWDEDEKKWVVDWGEAEGGQRGYRSKNLRSAAGQEDLTPENPDDLLRRCLLSNAKILDGQTATLRGVRLFGRWGIEGMPHPITGKWCRPANMRCCRKAIRCQHDCSVRERHACTLARGFAPHIVICSPPTVRQRVEPCEA